MVQPIKRRVATAAAGLLALALVGASMTAAAADDGDTDELSDASWYALADEAADQIEATDWEAVSAADGCELVDVRVSEVVDPELNEAVGAPADLAVPVVEREEVCEAQPLTSSFAFGGGASIDGGMGAQMAAASSCSTTSGPGSLCISRSGNYISTSFQYNGSGTISAFLKIYKISSTSGCPTGNTLVTSSTSSYSNGTRRSVSVYATASGAYSSHVWKYVGLGVHTDWGSACGSF